MDRADAEMVAITVADVGMRTVEVANTAAVFEGDLFSDVADEALIGGSDAVAETAIASIGLTAPLENSVTTDAASNVTQGGETLSASIAASVRGTPDTAAITLGATAQTGQSGTLSEQLVTTLNAGNGPPAVVNKGNLFVSASESAEYRARASALSADTVTSGSEYGILFLASTTGGDASTPATAAAVTNYGGNFTFAAGSTTTINITGKGAGQYDVINVGSAATLGGTLAVTLTGFAPAEGDTFDIINAGSFTGRFTAGTGLFGFGDRSLYLKVQQLPDRLRLVATKVSGDLMTVRPDTKAGADAFGQLLNFEHFATSSATFSGSITVSQFVSIQGTLNLTWVPSLTVTLTDNSTTTVFGLTIGGAGIDVFVGLGGPYLRDSNGDGRITASDTPNRDAVGLQLTNVNFGAVLFLSSSVGNPSAYAAISVTSSTGAFVGLETITAQAKNISVGINQVSSLTDTVLTPAPAIKFSALAGGGLNVAAGGGATVKLDFDQRFQRASVADLTLQLSEFIYLRGSFAFEKGQTVTVPLAGGGTTGVETMTVGASGAHVFIGLSGPYWQDSNNDGLITGADTPSSAAVGLALQNVSVGLLFAKETSLITPATYTALKVTATSAAAVGMSSAVTLVAKGITVGYNSVTSATDTALTPEAAINFSAMTGGGFNVPTGGTSVKLDFTDRIIRASVADVTLQISQFIYLRGSFAFEKGVTLTVPLAGGDNTEVETMTVGGSGIHVFVGMGGPYWQDSNNDGLITAADTPSTGAIGLALQNVNVGLLLAKETSLINPASYTALKATAATATTVGMSTALTIVAKGLTVGYNSVTSLTDTALTPEAAINFSNLTGGGLDVPTGGTPVKLDFTDRIIQAAVSDLTLAVSQFIYLRGSFAFEKGNTLTVPLAGGGTTEVETMTVGASGVHVFVGISGPYWQDSNNDGAITSADTPATGSIGLALENVNVGIVLAKETALTFVASYTALKVTAASASTVGMSSALTISAKNISIGFNTATSSTDTALTPEAAINFSAMTGGGLEVPTGGTPMKLDFSDRITRASVADFTLAVSQFIYLRGSFAFEKGQTVTVPLAGGGTTEVETMTVGASGVHVFVGISGPYWQDSNNDGRITSADTPSGSSIGLALENVNVGLLLAKETTLIVPASYTALKVTATTATTVGMGSVLTVTAKDINIGYNTATSATDSAILPEAAINFSTMTGGGFNVPTGGTPVKLDFTDRIIRASVADLTLQVSQFIYIRSSFAFEKGAVVTMPLAGGGTTEVETMTVGSSGGHAFVGISGPYWQDTNNDSRITSADTPSTGAIGLALENVNVGLLIAKETSLIFPATYTALKVTATTAQTVGMGSVITVAAKGISVGYNSVTSATDTALTPEAAIDFSTMTGGGFDVPTGGTPVKLDFTDRIIRASVADLTIAVSQFIFLRGSFAFEKGATLTVPLAGGGTTEVETMTVGASGAYAFVGLGGPYWQDSNNDGKVTSADTPVAGNAIGLALGNVNIGLLIAKETSLIVPASYTTLKVTAAVATTVGMGDVLTITAKGITVGYNTASSSTDTPLTPEAAINFSSMTGGGFDVPTGGTPVKLDFTDRIMRASVADLTLQVSEFIYVRGSAAFEKGVTQTVSLVGGLAPDPLGSSKELEFITVGGSHLYAFVGLKGPYWVDTTNDGLITAADTPMSGSAGLAIRDFSFGLAIMKPTSVVDPSKYFALKATAKNVSLVGISGVTATVDDITVELNQSSPSAYGVPAFPVVNFAAMPGGRYAINTGGINPLTNAPITVDLTMNSPLVRAEGFVHLNIANSVYVSGSVAFELGPQKTVTLSDNSTKTVMTMSVGIANASAFVGANGPYWTDTNKNRVVDTGELSTSAIGFSITNFTGGLFIGASTNLSDLGAYVGLKASVTGLGLVNMPAGMTLSGTFDIEANIGAGVGSGLAAINFLTSFPAAGSNPAGYSVRTGPSSPPVLLNFAGPKLDLKLQGSLGLSSAFGITGTFFFDISPGQLKVLADGQVTIAAGNFFNLQGVGVLVINKSGAAADIDVSIGANVPGLAITASARLIFNTTGVEQTITVPTKYVSSLSATTQGRLQTDGSGNKYYAIAAGAPLFDGTTGPAEPYVMVKANGSLVVASTLNLSGDFQVLISASQVSLRVKMAATFGSQSFAEVTGAITVSSAGLVGIIQAGVDVATPPIVGAGFELTLLASFEINTTSSSVSSINGITLQSALPATTVRAGGLGKLRFTLSSVAEFVLEGNFSLSAGVEGSGITSSGTFSGTLSANLGSITLLKFNASGGLAIYTGNAGIAGTLQISVGGSSKTGGIGFDLSGTFSMAFNTTGVARTIGTTTLAAGPYVRLHVDGHMQLSLAGVNIFKLGQGTFDLEVSPAGFLMAVDADVPIIVAGVTILNLHTTGALLINNAGLAAKLSLSPKAGSPLGGIGYRFAANTNFTLEVNTTSSAVTFNTSQGGVSVVAAGETRSGGPARAALAVSLPAGPYIQLRAQGSLYVGVGGALEMEIAGTTVLTISPAGLAFTIDGDLNLKVANSTLLRFTISNGALLVTSSGIAGKVGLSVGVSNVPGFSLSGNFALELNTTGSAIATINDTSVNLPAGPYVRVAGSGTLTIAGFVPLNGAFEFELASDHVKMKLDASISIFSSTLAIKTTGGIYADGVAFSVSIGTRIDLVSNISFRGTFVVKVNTTGSTRFGVSAQTVEIRIDDLSADFLGLSASGSVVFRVGASGFTFQIPSSNPLRLDFFGLATLDFSGYFNSFSDWSFTGHFGFGFDIGIAAASFDATLTIGSGDPFHFRFDARFHGSVLGGLASFTLTGFVSVGGGGDGLIRLGGSVEVTIDLWLFSISFDVPFEFTFGRLSISLPPVLGHVEGDGTLVLHVGADAALRLRNTQDDNENFTVEHVGGSAGNETVRVTALGVSQDYAGVKRVVVRDAGGGSDTINIKAGVQADAEINGGVGDDTITYSGSGKAILRGGSGNDNLTGGSGDDVLEGGGDRDQLYGNGGNDILRGGDGDDALFGHDGDDIIIGGAGNDQLDGGNGNDIYYFSAGFGVDNIADASGVDRIDFSNGESGAVSSGITFTITNSETKAVAGSHSVTHSGNSIERLIGGSGDDTFRFSNDVTVSGYVHGGAGGNDTLDLSAYTGSVTWNITNNSIGATAGRDEGLVGRTGGFMMPFESIENLLSGSGDDFFVFANTLTITGSVDSGRGADRFDFSTYTGGVRINIGDAITAGAAGLVNARSSSIVGNNASDRVRGFENVFGGAGNDVIVGNGANDYAGAAAGRNVLVGNGGDDTIFGVGGSDILIGDFATVGITNDGELLNIAGTNVQSGGNDIIDGGDGLDYILGGFGADRLTGGAGNDIIFGDNGQISFAAGLATVAQSGAGDAGGNDQIFGDAGDDVLIGGMGSDTINGGAGNDYIIGDGGSATFHATTRVVTTLQTTTAGAGAGDTIDAGDGANIVLGGAGADAITTGSGNDVAIGDSGRVTSDSAGYVTAVVTTDSAIGGADTLVLGAGDNIAFGGVGADRITTGDGRDIIVGDNGSGTFDPASHHLTQLQTADSADAGADTITAGNGNNVVLGGTGNDTITTGAGADIIVGDNGVANFYAATGILQNIETTAPTFVGNDAVNAGTGPDIILGGGGADRLDAGSTGDTSRDIVIGDNGRAEFDAAGFVTLVNTTVPTSGFDDDIILGGGDNIAFGGGGSDTITGGEGNDIIVGDNGSATFDATTHVVIDVRTTNPTNAGADYITGGNGNNIVLGGTDNDTITTGTGADIIVGDNGIATFYSTGILRNIETSDANSGGNDTINAGTGADVILGGSGNDSIDAGSVAAGDVSRDVVVGDNGRADFDSAGFLTLIYTTVPGTGGDDDILLGGGDNVAFGGVGADNISAGDGNDVIVGDNGSAAFHATALTLARVQTTDPTIGGIDSITTGDGHNVVLGGAAGDVITTGTGDDIVLGDNGLVDYVVNDQNPADLDLIASTDFDIGGADLISTGSGSDIVIGGALADEINAGTGNNIVFGDSAEILAAIADAPNFSSQPLTIGRMSTLAPGVGGNDTITTGTGRDIIFGGTGADTIVANAGESAGTPDADNIIFGDSGFIDYVRGERAPTALGADLSPADIDLISSSDFSDGGADTITTGRGSDIVIGGQGADTIIASDGTNLILGDSGIITAATENGNRFATQPMTIGRVETTAFGVGGADSITTGSGPDIILGGDAGDTITAGEGDNIVLGDDGAIDYVRQERDNVTPGADLNAADIDLIVSLSTTIAGGADSITTGAGNDIVIGGRAGDTINAGAGNNLVIGDSGAITAANEDANRFGGASITVGRIETIEFGDGGVDAITTLGGHDIILGGHLGDAINAGEGDNIVLGDDGVMDYVRTERDGGAGADTNAADIDLIVSLSTTLHGGADSITTGSGNDIVIGGRLGDTINAGTGNNVVIGDSGRIIAANSDSARFNRAGPALITFGRIETTQPGDGGDDTIRTGIGRDIILGGPAADTITANEGETASASDSDNIVLGDDGYIDFTRSEREGGLGADTDASDIDIIASTEFADGAADIITTGNGSDIVIAGQANDRVLAGHGSNIVIGDSGSITAANENLNRFTTQPIALGRIESTAFGVGGADTITTGDGNDIVIGGHEGDTIIAGEGDNIVAGDDAALEYVRQERENLVAGATPGADLNAGDIDYITSLSTTFAGGADTLTTGNGNDIVIGGRFGDTITANGGNNILIGDSGLLTAANQDLNRFASLGLTVGRIETIAFGDGGVDIITSLAGHDIILGGDAGDTITAGEGDNIVLGDDGAIDYVRQERDNVIPGADLNAADIDLIVSLSTTLAGGADSITTGAGNDIVIGGRAGDTVQAGAGNNIVIGDSGAITAANDNLSRFSTATNTTLTVGLIETITFGDGGIDVITTLGGHDIILGGHLGDTINAGDGDNIVLGDDGAMDYVRTERDGGSGADTNAADIDLIVSLSTTTFGGADSITTGSGNDIVIGGRLGDTINAGTGNNVVIGDSGRIIAANSDSARFNRVGPTLITFGRIETTQPGDGGGDTIRTGIGRDIILGGPAADTITANEGETASASDGDNIVLGDDGYIDFTRSEREGGLGADTDASDIDIIASTDFADGAADIITTGNGNDIVIAGQANDRVLAGHGSNIVIGDSGSITAANENVNRFTTQPIALGRIESTAFGVGGVDNITTGDGNDIVIGGHEGDTIIAGEGDNIVAGDDAALEYVRQERENLVVGATPGADLNAGDIDYITSLSMTAAGGADTITTGNGNDIVIGGRFGDTITANGGNNILIGDSGLLTAANQDSNRFASLGLTVGRIESIAFGDGGIDVITSLDGNDIILGGHVGDDINAGHGDNIVLGDDGAIDNVRSERDGGPGADFNAADIDLIVSLSTTLHGGADWITTGSGNDIVIGGRFGDTVIAGEGNNIVIGDSGRITAANDNLNRFSSATNTTITVGLIETITFGDGGADSITTGAGTDVILGGHDGDTIVAGNGDNLVFGDDGAIDYVRSERDGGAGADTNAGDIDLIVSLSTTAFGGADTITTGIDNDIVIGGRFGDNINAGTGNNLVIGDSGRIIAANSDSARFNRAGPTLITFGRIETTQPGDGGDDTIRTGIGRDIILGGPAADTITANEGETASASDGDNIVLGDDGYIDFTRSERDGGLGADTDASDIDIIASTDFADGAADLITTGNGNDIVIAGQANDRVLAGHGSNIVIGDSGSITAANENVNRFTTQPIALGRIESTAFGVGGVDNITTGDGNDIVIGGHESDTIIAGEGDNIVAGDDAALEYVRQERENLVVGATPGADLNAGDIDYITSLSTTAAGGADTITTGNGNDIIIGGRFGDTVTANAGNNIVIGDSGLLTAANQDVNRFASLGLTVGRIETIAFGDGGIDIITSLGGNDIILGGHLGDVINAGDGNNLVLGDDGAIDNVRSERDGGPGADFNAADIDLIVSLSTTLHGGADWITTGSGNDIVIGGRFGDTVLAGEGNNIVIGDSGRITAANDNLNRFSSATNTTVTVGLIETITFGDGGADTITTGAGVDVVLGGHDADTINAGNGDNLVLGDDGLIDYVRGDRGATGPGVDINAGDIDLILSTSTKDFGGVDRITTGTGNDIVIGGRFGDTIVADAGKNIVIGDSGRVTAANEDANRFSSAYVTSTLTVGLIETITPDDGGSDTITTLGGNDVVLGGQLGDVIDAGDGDNVVLGDDGLIDYVRVERGNSGPGADTNAADIDYIVSLSTTANGGVDRITTGSGNDIIIGGRFGDTIVAGNGNNIAVGDSAAITAVTEDAPRFGTQFITVGRIETIQTEDGGKDEIRTGNGQDVVIGGADADRLDSGAGDDMVLGDNAVLDRTGRVNNFTSYLFQALRGTLIYDINGNLLVNGVPANQPGVAPIWGDMTLTLLDHSFAVQTTPNNRFGNDYIAAGAGNDRIFGGLGDDIIQGDGSIDLAVSARRLADGTLQVAGSVEAATDGDDYIEGNGGNDLIFGGLGQDDIIGGSSDLFGLKASDPVASRALRPDGADLIFGGAGVDLAHNDAGDTSATGRGRDADTIIGDNGHIYRLVGINGIAGPAYLTFNYDIYGALKIIPRGVDFLDYTPGGLDLSASAVNDIGGNDEIHGESGNDIIYGQLGNDVIFGEGQDDDIIGGTGNDWISSGTGEDGVLGDDGRIFNSRNGTVEPLYGIAAIPEGGLNLRISTPGDLQVATINVAGVLKKTAILEPFDLTDHPTGTPKTASSDIIFGGLGNDALHGGAGDDAISGTEALAQYYAKPFNPGNYLGWGLVRPGEFAAYDEYNPRAKIYVNPVTFEFSTQAAGGIEFILNFLVTEEGNRQDGDDILFGDSGNDWLVGGMGRDHLYGGYGDDMLNADDNHETNGGRNDLPDGPATNQEDLAYGGAGRDILIANTGGDRLIDWAGEFNSYIVPFSNFGAATVSRTLQPQLAEFLYDLSQSDGADFTRATKTGSAVARNGEPEGELGMVRQHDFDWSAQTGGPADPQAGNIPGGRRDVLRSANFNNGSSDGFVSDSGTWEVLNGRLQITPPSGGGQSIALFNIQADLPRYYEVQLTINAVKPTAGYKANAYIVFDYYSETDFKFAGIDVSTNKIVIGHRNASGWIVNVSSNFNARDNTDYNLLLAVNGTNATIVVDNSRSLTFSFGPRVVDGYSNNLNTGYVGVAGDNSRVQIDNIAVQVLPPTITFQNSEDFADGSANLLTGDRVGAWSVAAGRYVGTPGSAGFAVSNFNFGLGANSILQIDTTLRVGANGSSAGVVFDYYDANNFKFAAVVAGTNQVIIGHYSKSTWTIDATISRPITANTDYSLSILLKGTTVSVNLNGQAALGFAFNAVVTDGQAGLFTRGGASSFSSYLVKTDDPKMQGVVVAGSGTSVTSVISVTLGDSLASSGSPSGSITGLSLGQSFSLPTETGNGLWLRRPDEL